MEMNFERSHESVSRIIEKYANMVFRLCIVYLKNRADAEDAFQEVFMKLYEKELKFNSEDHLKAWLITVTSNHCKNKLKSFWFRKRVMLDEVIIPVQDKNHIGIIREVLQLPPKYSSPIYLYYYEGYSTKEIAQMLNTKEATIRTRLDRGREHLKKMMEGGF